MWLNVCFSSFCSTITHTLFTKRFLLGHFNLNTSANDWKAWICSEVFESWLKSLCISCPSCVDFDPIDYLVFVVFLLFDIAFHSWISVQEQVLKDSLILWRNLLSLRKHIKILKSVALHSKNSLLSVCRCSLRQASPGICHQLERSCPKSGERPRSEEYHDGPASHLINLLVVQMNNEYLRVQTVNAYVYSNMLLCPIKLSDSTDHCFFFLVEHTVDTIYLSQLSQSKGKFSHHSKIIETEVLSTYVYHPWMSDRLHFTIFLLVHNSLKVTAWVHIVHLA